MKYVVTYLYQNRKEVKEVESLEQLTNLMNGMLLKCEKGLPLLILEIKRMKS